MDAPIRYGSWGENEGINDTAPKSLRESRPRWPFIAAPSVGTVWKWRLAAWRIVFGRRLRRG